MFLNIITPCTRPQNLQKIAESINIPRENYRWLVVFDSLFVPEKSLIPVSCEHYLHRDKNSISGNAQRNFALSKVLAGHVYFNDDDTTIHPDLWSNIYTLDEHDFISFSQNTSAGDLRLKGNRIQMCHIDSHNYIVSKKLIKGREWDLSMYEADGFFAEGCYREAKSPIFINKVLSIYNSLNS